MEEELWRPLSVRQSGSNRLFYDVLHDGIPAWLRQTVLLWLGEYLMTVVPHTNRSVAHVRHLMTLQRRLRLDLDWSSQGDSALADLIGRMENDAEMVLNVMDAALADGTGSRKADYLRAEELRGSLLQAGSVWDVAETSVGFELQRRVTKEVVSVAEASMRETGRPGEYLSQAWHRAFGRDPQPDGAYRDAVRAIEAAMKPLVSPNNGVTTLGTVIRDMRAKTEKWRMRLSPQKGSPVEALAALLETLWSGQLDRHGTDDDAVPLNVSLEEAQDAAVIAAMVVDLIHRGGFVTK